MGQKVSCCCGCGRRGISNDSNEKMLDKHQINGGSYSEQESWKKWSSFNAATLAEDQSYIPPAYVSSTNVEASWEL